MSKETKAEKVNKYASNLFFNEQMGQAQAASYDKALQDAAKVDTRGMSPEELRALHERQEAINAAAKAGDIAKLNELQRRKPLEETPIKGWIRKKFGKKEKGKEKEVMKAGEGEVVVQSS